MRRGDTKRLRYIAVAIAALVAAAIPVLSSLGGNGSNHVAGEPVEGAAVVEVIGIIDGDTLDVRSGDSEFRVRLYGVDTPERDEACYDEATERLDALAGAEVQLLEDRRRTDDFGRELRYVYTADGTLIDEQLVREGYGYAWTDDGRFRGRIVAAETEARDEGRGCLWE